MTDKIGEKAVGSIIKYSMMGSVAVYVVVGYFVSENSITYNFHSIKSKPVLLTLCALALLSLLMGRKLAQIAISKKTEPNTDIRINTTRLIVELAVYEIAAIIGLVLTLTYSSTQFVIAFGLATLLQQAKVSLRN